MSCKQKDDCYPEFYESLSYVKEYADTNDTKTRFHIEIHRNIEVLESTSGILNRDRGFNTLNDIYVTQDDIDNWQAWISRICDSIKRTELVKDVY